MTMRLIIVRHGETKANLSQTLQGQTDGELTDVGLHQVKQLAHRLRNIKIDQIFSSDLYRARQTVELIAAFHNPPVQFSIALREWNVGDLEGKPAEALALAFQRANVPKPEYKPPGGESLIDLQSRAGAFLNELLEIHSNKVVLVSSHGDFIRMLMSVILSIKIEEAIRQDIGNTSLSILDHLDNREWKTIEINNTSHLMSEIGK